MHMYCSSDVMRYDEMELDEESEPEIPIYNRAELIERYQVMISSLSSEVLHRFLKIIVNQFIINCFWIKELYSLCLERETKQTIGLSSVALSNPVSFIPKKCLWVQAPFQNSGWWGSLNGQVICVSTCPTGFIFALASTDFQRCSVLLHTWK